MQLNLIGKVGAANVVGFNGYRKSIYLFRKNID
jgi:hypothetical protein